MPPERHPLLCERLQRHDLLRRALLLQAVPVYYGGKVVQLEMRSAHRSFPRLAHIVLSIAEKNIDSRRALVKAGGKRHSYADAQTLAFRASTRLDARSCSSLRMALETRAHFPERHQLLYWKESPLC